MPHFLGRLDEAISKYEASLNMTRFIRDGTRDELGVVLTRVCVCWYPISGNDEGRVKYKVSLIILSHVGNSIPRKGIASVYS